MASKKKTAKLNIVRTEAEVDVPEVDEKVAKALIALEEYANYDQDKIDYIVAKCSVAALDHHGELAKLAIEETGRGVFDGLNRKQMLKKACTYR